MRSTVLIEMRLDLAGLQISRGQMHQTSQEQLQQRNRRQRLLVSRLKSRLKQVRARAMGGLLRVLAPPLSMRLIARIRFQKKMKTTFQITWT